MSEEKRLIQLARSGDDDAFEELIRKYGDKIYGISIRLTGDKEKAKDLVQDVFVRAFRSIKNFKGDSSFGTWLYRIANNRWIDLCRKMSFNKEVEMKELAEENIPLSHYEDNDVYEAMEEMMKEKNIWFCFDFLEPEERFIIMYRIYLEKPYKEIAEILDISINSIGGKLKRAVGKLNQIYKEKFGDEL